MIIISGGQTGVDRAALDAALDNCFQCGGWCPQNRVAEDGQIDNKYPLRELLNAGYPERTLKNIQDSNATLIVHFGLLAGGTGLTLKLCKDNKKNYLLIDGLKEKTDFAARTLVDFSNQHDILTLNVAGPRASKTPQAYSYTYSLISLFIKEIKTTTF